MMSTGAVVVMRRMKDLWVAVVLGLLLGGCEHSATAGRAAGGSAGAGRGAVAGGEQGTDQQIIRDNAFIEAVRDRQVAKAVALLKAGADPSARYIDREAFLSGGETGYTALLYASLNGDIDAVKVLLSHNADVHYQRKGRSAMYLAATAGHEEVARLLKAAGAEGDPKAMRLTQELLRASCRGFEMGPGEGYPPYPGVVREVEDAPTIAEVLKRGADVNGADPEGYTALMYAANLGLVENVKVLLAQGADPGRRSTRGDTAASLAGGDSVVHRAARAQVVELLNSHGGGQRGVEGGG